MSAAPGTAASASGSALAGQATLPGLEEILAAPTLFAALGLQEVLCEDGVVKSRYRLLALRVHPDKCSDARAKRAFQRISEAYDILHTRSGQERYLKELGRGQRLRGRRRRGGGGGEEEDEPHAKREGTDTARGGKAWWDTSTWDEFERRFRNREEMEAALRAKYFAHFQGRFQHRRLRTQVKSAERSCEMLDSSRGIGPSDLWPPELRELPNKAELQVPAFEGAKTAWDELLERCELDDPEYCATRLVDLLTHLRTVHVYCLHCGCHYEGAEDLERCCPGFDEEAHENAENMAMARRAPEEQGVTRELAPPPKRAKVPPALAPHEEVGDTDDPLNALLAGRGRVQRKRAGSATGGGEEGGPLAAAVGGAGAPTRSGSFGFSIRRPLPLC